MINTHIFYGFAPVYVYISIHTHIKYNLQRIYIYKHPTSMVSLRYAYTCVNTDLTSGNCSVVTLPTICAAFYQYVCAWVYLG